MIYEQFYSLKSAADQGSFFQLRNVVRRVDVQGKDGITSSYRSHMNFMKDCLASFVLGSCLDMFGTDSLDGCPTKFHIPLFLHLSSPEDQYAWLKQLGEQLVQKYVKLDEEHILTTTLTERTSEMDGQELLIAEMYNSDRSQFVCTCSKMYKTKGHFRRHLKEKHGWKLSKQEETTSEVDHIAV
ncbi:uncharacterized protein LOC125656920 [Ostrea edulis]|uniref:uncharacterized protein LOC125656920 n=1 Tax=Ostrea edulis TaxID=37623 RepID=UPI0024AFEE12|nr:uncharacterized protein LOC125656920 [Ostrea edulis]